MLASTFNPVINQGVGANNQLSAMLGLNGTQGQDDAFKNWQKSTGYQFGLNQGTNAITGNAATHGLLNSGSTAKAINTFGQDYANTQYGKYTDQLQNLVGNSLGGGGLVANAGQQSVSSGTSKSNESKGAGGFIGSLLGK